MDQRLLAAPHGFSQRATSFIASWCQGIHRTPFSCSLPRDRSSEDVDPILHRNHPTHLKPKASDQRTYPQKNAALPKALREQTFFQTDAQNAHPFSLTLLNKLVAGIRSLDLVRSDMQQIRADAPNPDSRFKEHFQQHPQVPPTHDIARLNLKLKRSLS